MFKIEGRTEDHNYYYCEVRVIIVLLSKKGISNNALESKMEKMEINKDILLKHCQGFLYR